MGEAGIGDIAPTQPMRDEIIERAVKAGINYFDINYMKKKLFR
ncbi:MAG: hypothetical protein QXR45_00595 [Candidatus Bathyarchaeia archaeon]